MPRDLLGWPGIPWRWSVSSQIETHPGHTPLLKWQSFVLESLPKRRHPVIVLVNDVDLIHEYNDPFEIM